MYLGCRLGLPLRIGLSNQVEILFVQNGLFLLALCAATLPPSPFSLLGLLILLVVDDEAFSDLQERLAIAMGEPRTLSEHTARAASASSSSSSSSLESSISTPASSFLGRVSPVSSSKDWSSSSSDPSSASPEMRSRMLMLGNKAVVDGDWILRVEGECRWREQVTNPCVSPCDMM